MAGFFVLTQLGNLAKGKAFQARRRALATTVRALSGGTDVYWEKHDGFSVATKDGVRVNGTFGSADGKQPQWLDVTAEDCIPTDLLIGSEGLSSRIGKLLAGGDVETGDPEFDREVLLRGSEARLLAILDATTRSRVRAAIRAGTTVSNGAVRGTLLNNLTDGGAIVTHSRALVSLTRAICERLQEPARLLRGNVEKDPLVGVRRRSLEILLEHFPDHPETEAALLAASGDADPEVRLFASSRRSGGGADEGLAAIVADPTLDDTVRANALRRLLAANTGARAIAHAERALDDRSSAVRTLGIDVIGRARRSLSMPKLLALAAEANTPAEQLALADAFWRLRDPAAETVLVAMMGSAADPAVRVQCARALGRSGGVAAVEPLRKVQGLLAGELGRVAEEAIAAIQGRLRNASEGQLTVTESPGGEGRVSLSADRGAVSIPPKPPRGS